MKPNYISLAIFLIGAALYLNTVPNQYAYDDYSVVEGNAFTRQGLAGISGHLLNDSFTGFTGQKNLFRGGRYRPLSLVTFSMEYQFFGAVPGVSHLVNVILYGLTCLLLFRVMERLFRERNHFRRFSDIFSSVSLMTAVVFAVHPVHTEVAANIKGRDELLALLFGLLAWNSAIRYAGKRSIWHAAGAGGYLFLALMSKESAAPFLVLIPLSLIFFRYREIPVRSMAWPVVALVTGFTAFLLIRQGVLGWEARPAMADNILSNSFLYAQDVSQRYGTTLYTMGLYLKLLVFPHPLTIDYYPFHIPYVGMGDPRALVPLALYLALTVSGVVLAIRRHPAGFGILFYLAALFPVSNLPFIVGPFMGERFLFIPSVGFAILCGWGVAFFSSRDRLRKWVPLVASLVLLVFSVRTIVRNTDWKDNFTLYTHDVQTSANSAVINKGAGQQYLIRAQSETDKARRRELARKAIPYLEKAARLNRTETETFLLGNACYEAGDHKRSMEMYLQTLQISRGFEKAIANFFVALNHLPSPDEKIRQLDRLAQVTGDRYDLSYNRGLVYGKQMGMIDSAIRCFYRACRIDSTRAECLSDLGVALAMKGDLVHSAEILEKALHLNPGDLRVRQNLAATYLRLGMPGKAKVLIPGR